MYLSAIINLFKELLPIGLLGLAWLAYLIWGARWLRGVRRARLF
jgi:hypothetical protein